MHNGGVDSLAQMVRLMAEHQTARGTLEDREADAIVAFLGSLTGEIPKDYIAKPELPENGPNTPGPDPS
jgi:cytochrome c peroxidase